MDFLNKSVAQVAELFRTMTPGARITAGLLFAVVVISLGYLFQHGTAGPDAFLFGGEPLADGELNRIEGAIAQAGLSGHVREGNRIRVPGGQQAAYMAAVADAGALPPNFNTLLENALNDGGPWETREATRERLKIAKQQTLREIIRAMHWVEDAMVLYDEQQPRGLSGQKLVTGSVSVRPMLGEALDARRAKVLQKLVAHAVVGLKSEDVAVTNLGDGTIGYDREISPENFDDEYQQTRVAFEMQKRESIMNALRFIPGISVEVNAELDDTVEERTHNVKPDPKAVPRREVSSNEKSTQSGGQTGGQPGPVSSGPTRQAAITTPPQKTNETSSDTIETENVVGMEQNSVVKRGYTPKEIWATVTIPSTYIEALWKQRNPTVTNPPTLPDMRLVHDEVVLKVENIVEPLLLVQAIKGEDTYKHVRVVVLDSLPAPIIEPPSTSSRALAWAGRYWGTIAMLGVAMFSLLVLRSIVKGSPPADAATAAVPALTLHGDDSTNQANESSGGEDEPPADRPRLRLKKPKSLKDDLVQIVHDDPNAAADILRSWIGKAG